MHGLASAEIGLYQFVSVCMIENIVDCGNSHFCMDMMAQQIKINTITLELSSHILLNLSRKLYFSHGHITPPKFAALNSPHQGDRDDSYCSMVSIQYSEILHIVT